MPELKTIVVSIMSPGVAVGGGGFVIVGGKLKKIPPHSPKLKELNAALGILSQSENFADRKIQSQIAQLTEPIVTANINALVEEIGK